MDGWHRMNAPASALSVEHVTKTYPLGGVHRPVLRDVSFVVGHNEIVSIVGASGCGKSTLLRLIVGLDTDYRGSITKHDANASDRRIGMVFQDHRLYPWLTVEANVGLALDNSALSQAQRREKASTTSISSASPSLPRPIHASFRVAWRSVRRSLGLSPRNRTSY